MAPKPLMTKLLIILFFPPLLFIIKLNSAQGKIISPAVQTSGPRGSWKWEYVRDYTKKKLIQCITNQNIFGIVGPWQNILAKHIYCWNIKQMHMFNVLKLELFCTTLYYIVEYSHPILQCIKTETCIYIGHSFPNILQFYHIVTVQWVWVVLQIRQGVQAPGNVVDHVFH